MLKLIKEKILNLITKKTKIDLISLPKYAVNKTDYVVCKKTFLEDYYGDDYILFKKNNLYPAEYFKGKVIGIWSYNLNFYSLYNIGGSEVTLIHSERLMFFKEHFKTQLEPNIILEKKCNIF